MITRSALQVCASEERIQDYKNKWHNHILRIDFSRLTHKLRITGRRNEEMLEDQEDDGRIVF
jgi:hypothetical protein